MLAERAPGLPLRAALGVGLALALGAAAGADAGTVTLEIGVDCAAEPLPGCSVAVANRGPEAAHQVVVALAAAGAEERTEPVALLAPGDTLTRLLPARPPAGAGGSYAAAVTVSYADANGHPLSAAAAAVLPLAAVEPPALSASVRDLELATHGGLELALTNLAAGPLTLSVRWHLPRELAVAEAPRTLHLAPGEAKRERFRVVNQGALPGSAYTVWAILETGTATAPVALVVPGRVAIGEPGADRLRLALIAVLAVLLAVWLAAQWGARRRR